MDESQAEMRIRNADELRDHMGPVSRLAEGKVLARLDPHARAFIALSPFLVVATADAEGRADASPRGDAPGFVQVLDDATLLIPDRRGNNRADSFGNLLAAPGIGLIFLVPGVTETLRVNGTARITTDVALLTPLAAQGKVPTTGLLVAVREAFFHCGKAVMRARLWDPAAQVPRGTVPSLGRILAEQTGALGVTEAERLMEESYRTRLY
ncbi:pyridoxamine 5'-phosphate oxidase [Methylobacterium indicum]|uniref:pyridoxamine 5'-phosphate oxidase family protein n=1 Tax=Methylobacterium indicum TaxID=1775910 RepID=UPI0007345613|nr:pyridoxamine 5'-phosphate oxidase family protein [Methylobacterium indicum]KTS33631.1 pyridoxamine 5'-phosphate oxidase [Methylobacterium indicum]KTS47468.1 pyridoxamine 5'-phosphate oxidase [Methylobacterium indicum]